MWEVVAAGGPTLPVPARNGHACLGPLLCLCPPHHPLLPTHCLPDEGGSGKTLGREEEDAGFGAQYELLKVLRDLTVFSTNKVLEPGAVAKTDPVLIAQPGFARVPERSSSCRAGP